MAEYDLFVVGGQSNALGYGDSTLSPTPTTGTAIEYDNATDSIIDPLTDPVQGNNDEAQSGSAWPKFCIDYYEKTGNNIAIVGAAKGGTAQVAAAERPERGNWDDTGQLDDDLITFVNNAIAKLEQNGDTPRFRGILWHQGEQDAGEIDGGVISKSEYKNAFQNMIARFRTEFGANMPMWVFELGQPDGGDTIGYQSVREAQQEVVKSQDPTYLVSDKQKNFPANNQMSDNVHYNQDGYNFMGQVGALNVAARTETGSIFQLLRGESAAISSYTGQAGEGTVDTTDNRLVVHDGATQGGFEVLKQGE